MTLVFLNLGSLAIEKKFERVGPLKYGFGKHKRVLVKMLFYNGGAFLSSFKLPALVCEDVLVLAERLCELGYSLETVIKILNRPPEKKSKVIL